VVAGEAGINAEMVRRSKRAVVVAASPKLGQRAFARICGSDTIAPLVTDRDASDAHVGPLREAGVEVLLAGRGGWPWATRARLVGPTPEHRLLADEGDVDGLVARLLNAGPDAPTLRVTAAVTAPRRR
jgi:hypothetical protein